jgi:hypothetical protein
MTVIKAISELTSEQKVHQAPAEKLVSPDGTTIGGYTKPQEPAEFIPTPEQIQQMQQQEDYIRHQCQQDALVYSAYAEVLIKLHNNKDIIQDNQDRSNIKIDIMRCLDRLSIMNTQLANGNLVLQQVHYQRQQEHNKTTSTT